MSGGRRGYGPSPSGWNGRVFGDRYRVLTLLRSGRLTAVFRAWDETQHRHVAVKVSVCPSVGPASDDLMLHEAAVLKGLRHSGVVPLLDAGVDQGVPYLVMPYLGGGTLEHRRFRRDDGLAVPMDVAEVWHWLPPLAAALDFVHASGSVHGDVKSTNILFDGTGMPFLADFGSAQKKTGEIDSAADQFALATTVLQWLMGDEPPGRKSGSAPPGIAGGEASDLATRRPDLPEVATAAVTRGMRSDPTGRFPSCEAFAAALLAATPRPTSVDKVQLGCPCCERLLTVNPASAGRRGRCPKCGEGIVVAPDLQSLELAAFRSMVRRSDQTERSEKAWSLPGLGRFAMLAAALFGIVAFARWSGGTREAVNRPTSPEPIRPPFVGLEAPAEIMAREGPPPGPAVADTSVVEPSPPGDPAVDPGDGAPIVAVPEPPARPLIQPEAPAPNAHLPHPVARLPVPPDDAVAQATSRVQDAFVTDYRRAAERSHALWLTESLLQAVKETHDPLRRYAMLLEIERLCLEDGRIEDAIGAVRKRCSLYACDPEPDQQAALGLALESRHLHSPGMCRQAMNLAERFLGEEDFSSARAALDVASRAASGLESEEFRNCRERLVNVERSIDERQQFFEEFVAARDAVVKDPSDVKAAGTAGTYLCLARRDWVEGIPHLAASDLPAIGDLARRHIQVMGAAPVDARAAMGVAEDWWRVAEGEIAGPWADARKDAVRQFAASLYSSLVDELDDPFERRLAAERAGRSGN